MKKFFAYLLIALMMAAMLCGCGMDSKDGVVGSSPRPTEDMDIIPSMRPDVSPTIIPEAETTADVNSGKNSSGSGESTDRNGTITSPQVGESSDTK